MRTLFLALTCLIGLAPIAVAQTDDCVGSYGCDHHRLHGFGTIPKLIEKTGKNCCDGGTGGECRKSSIKFENGVPLAYLEGRWCPITGVDIRTDIPMPGDIEAVVCASKGLRSNGCPKGNYCAAANWSG